MLNGAELSRLKKCYKALRRDYNQNVQDCYCVICRAPPVNLELLHHVFHLASGLLSDPKDFLDTDFAFTAHVYETLIEVEEGKC